MNSPLHAHECAHSASLCICACVSTWYVCLLAALISLPVAALIWTAALIPFESDSITWITMLVLWTNSPKDTETERKKGRTRIQDFYCFPLVALGHCVLQFNSRYLLHDAMWHFYQQHKSELSIFIEWQGNCQHGVILSRNQSTAKMAEYLQRVVCGLFVNCVIKVCVIYDLYLICNMV